jgi:hypothetical protein
MKYMHPLQLLAALIRMCDLIRLLVYLLVEKVLNKILKFSTTKIGQSNLNIIE